MTPIRDKREAIGAVSLEARGHDRLTLGYALAPEAWGKGLASEAVEAMVEAAFVLTNAVEIVASVRVENAASRRVLEKAGFRIRRHRPPGRAGARRHGPVRPLRHDPRRLGRAARGAEPAGRADHQRRRP